MQPFSAFFEAFKERACPHVDFGGDIAIQLRQQMFYGRIKNDAVGKRGTQVRFTLAALVP
jgi:hypothetical protein